MRKLLSLLGAAGAAVAFVVAATPASAAGTGGIEVTPMPIRDSSGHQTTSFHLTPHDGKATGSFELRNLTGKPNSARLYGAAARLAADGDYSVGDAASGSWLGLGDRTITLAPNESRLVTFTATTSATHDLGAVVLEVSHGTIVTRAATLVTIVHGSGLTAKGIGILAGGIAGGLALLVGLGHLVLLGLRRSRREDDPEGDATVADRELVGV